MYKPSQLPLSFFVLGNFRQIEPSFLDFVIFFCLKGLLGEPWRKCKPTVIFQSPEDHNSSSTTFLLASATSTEIPDLKNLLHQGRLSLQLESSQETSVLNRSNSAPALDHHMVTVPRHQHVDRETQYTHQGRIRTQGTLRSKWAPAVRGPTARPRWHLICHERYL